MRYCKARALRIPLGACLSVSLLLASCSTCPLVGVPGDPSCSELAPGDKIIVKTLDGNVLHMAFDRMSSDTLFGRFYSDRRVVPLAEIESIQRCGFSPMKTAVVVSGLGLVVGLVALGLANMELSGSCGEEIDIGMGM